MADGREPPPNEESAENDDDDLFSEAIEVINQTQMLKMMFF